MKSSDMLNNDLFYIFLCSPTYNSLVVIVKFGMEEDLFGSDSEDSACADGSEGGDASGSNNSCTSATLAKHSSVIPLPIVNEIESFIRLHSSNLIEALVVENYNGDESQDIADQLKALVEHYTQTIYSETANVASTISSITFRALQQNSSWPCAS